MKQLTSTERTQRYNLLRALETFANQRPGIDPRNYGCDREGWKNYRSESRQVTRDLHDFRIILAAVERSEMSALDIMAATRAYSGRLEILYTAAEGYRIRYCTGQYFPTEFRKAACAVLACALWDYHRPDCTGERPGDEMREKFARMFPRTSRQEIFRLGWPNLS